MARASETECCFENADLYTISKSALLSFSEVVNVEDGAGKNGIRPTCLHRILREEWLQL
jgi:hypothetical protein